MELANLTLSERALFSTIRGANFKAKIEVLIKGKKIGIGKLYLGTVATLTTPIDTPLTNDELNILAVIRNFNHGRVVIDVEDGKGKLNPFETYTTIDFSCIDREKLNS